MSLMDEDIDFSSYLSSDDDSYFSDTSHVGPTYELKRLGYIKPMEGAPLKRPPYVLNYLNQRINGCENRASTRSLHLTLLTPFIKNWLCSEKYSLITLARKLLQRKLCAWEAFILDHLQENSSKIIFNGESRYEKLLTEDSLFQNSSLLPVNFIEVLEVLYKVGVDLNCLDLHSRKSLAVKFVKYCRHDAGEVNSLQFFNYLVERGVVINNNANDTLLALCKALNPSACKITRETVGLFKLLFAAKPEGQSNALLFFLRNLADGVNTKAVDIVRMFIENGYFTDGAFEEFCNNDQSFRTCLYFPEKLDVTFLIYELLVERCSASIEKKIRHTAIFKLYDAFKSVRKAPSSIELTHFVVEQCLHRNALYQDDETLLSSICRTYCKDDLPELIEYLCSRSCNVNHLNYASHNALFNLAENRLNISVSPAIEETMRVLIKHGINLNHRDKCRQSALRIFLNQAPLRCCSYASLLSLEDLNYWSRLELLINAGCPVESTLYQALRLFVKCNLCSKCALKKFGIAVKSGSIATPGLLHFRRFLQFVEKIIAFGADFVAEFHRLKFDSAIIYACAHYKGEELIAIVKLLCQSGFDVNALTMVRPKTFCRSLRSFYRRPKNAIQVLRIENETEIGRVDELLDILLMYGFKP